MNALYIGILTDWTTSRMRAETMRRLTVPYRWKLIDTDEGFRRTSWFWKTIAFRFKAGPLVRQINRRVVDQTEHHHYDLVWVDKGVYLWPETVVHLRKRAECLVHFTPDTAFYANRSRHFFAAASQYDLLITTKSFEWEKYAGIADHERVYLTTQAYDADLHRPPPEPLPWKKPAAVFIGLCERDREECIEALLTAGVPVRLGGRGWEKFLSTHSSNPALCFLGNEVFGDDYVFEYASAMVGLGLMSKLFPELHTTRTFEIPAIGTLLATERTVETEQFFNDDEVLFFNNYRELADRLAELLKEPVKVAAIAKKGRQRVINGGYDYASVLSAVLRRLSLPETSKTSLKIVDRGSCIGFLGADWWGSDPRAMAMEFRQQGYLLLERHYEDYLSTKWRSLSLRLLRRLAMPWIKRAYNRAVEEILSVGAVDFLLVFKGMLLDAETLAKFHFRNIPCYLFYPDVSFKDHGRNIWKCLPLYDRVFTTKSFHLENDEIRERVKSIQLVNHGFDPAVHRPIALNPGLISAYGCDVSFVGSWSPKKEQIVRRLIEAMPDLDLRLWGPQWERADPAVQEKWAGRGAYGDEMAAVYSFSKINLGLLSEAGTGTVVGDQLTARTWQIPATGGFLLHEDNPEIRKYFQPEREVGLFGDDQEMVSQVKAFLHDDARREQIRKAGQLRALSAPYTYGPAVEAILEYHAANVSSYLSARKYPGLE